jgi:hypothetical protein
MRHTHHALDAALLIAPWGVAVRSSSAQRGAHALWARALPEATKDKGSLGDAKGDSSEATVAPPCEGELLGRFSDRCELLSAGGPEFWLYSAAVRVPLRCKSRES